MKPTETLKGKFAGTKLLSEIEIDDASDAVQMEGA